MGGGADGAPAGETWPTSAGGGRIKSVILPSGLGVGGIPHTMHEMTRLKMVVFNP